MLRMLPFLMIAISCGATPAAPATTVPPPPQSEAAASRPYLGLSPGPLDPFTRRHLDLPPGQGIAVVEVAADSPAAAAGLKAGDILLRLDRQVLFESTPLVDSIRLFQPGQKLAVTYLRKGVEVSTEAILGSRPEISFTPPPPRLGLTLDPFDRHFADRLRRLPSFAEEASRCPAPLKRRSLIVSENAEGRIELRDDGRGWRLKALAPDGSPLFEGPWMSEADKEKAPATVRRRAEALSETASRHDP